METNLPSKNIFGTGVQKSLLRKSYIIDFKAADWVEISLVYNESDQQNIIYASNNTEWRIRC